jgi:hypothetical protein
MLTFFYLLKISHILLKFVIDHRFLLKCHFFIIYCFDSLQIFVNEMTSVECIVVPLMLNAIFLMYANFKMLGFKYQHLTFVLYCNMFCTIHMTMNVFPMPTFLVKKGCRGFDGCLLCIKYHLQ